MSKKSEKKYIRKIIEAGNTLEVINYISGRIGARGNGRGEGEQEGESEEKVQRWKWKRAEDKCRWLINQNFGPGDLWMRFGYPRGTRKTPAEIRDDVKKFLEKLRRMYRRAGKELKYLYTVGIGSRGGIHFHAVFSAFDSEKIEELWQDIAGTEQVPYPSVNTRHLDRRGHYPSIAAYIIKNARQTFGTDRQIFGKRYCASRNLQPPKIRKVIVHAGHWLKKPKPKKGYYILQDSVRQDIGQNGFPYQSYTMVRLQI